MAAYVPKKVNLKCVYILLAHPADIMKVVTSCHNLSYSANKHVTHSIRKSALIMDGHPKKKSLTSKHFPNLQKPHFPSKTHT